VIYTVLAAPAGAFGLWTALSLGLSLTSSAAVAHRAVASRLTYEVLLADPRARFDFDLRKELWEGRSAHATWETLSVLALYTAWSVFAVGIAAPMKALLKRDLMWLGWWFVWNAAPGRSPDGAGPLPRGRFYGQRPMDLANTCLTVSLWLWCIGGAAWYDTWPAWPSNGETALATFKALLLVGFGYVGVPVVAAWRVVQILTTRRSVRNASASIV